MVDSCVKKVYLNFITDDPTSGQQIRKRLLHAVCNNMHLQSVRLKVNPIENRNIKKESNADKDCCMLLHRYCERNRKLQGTLEGADSIPLAVWPYIYQLASRGGADMLYRHVCENVGYVLKSHDGYVLESHVSIVTSDIVHKQGFFSFLVNLTNWRASC